MKIKLPIVSVVIVITIFLVVAYLAFFQKKALAPTSYAPTQKQASPSASAPSFTGSDDVLKNALNLYISKKQSGTDMTNGPCLGKIAADWVLDIAHNPRQPVDDKEQNQCADFRSGAAHHFIELDPNGNLIQSR